MRTLIILFLLIGYHSGASQISSGLITNHDDLILGTSLKVFGDNSSLREEPNVDSKRIATLKIGESVKVLEKSEATYSINGLEHNWYKIQADEDIGYIVGGLLAISTLKKKDDIFHFNYAKEGWQDILLVRWKEGSSYNERKFPLLNTEFDLIITDGQGLQNVKSIIHVDYFSEACGVQGGSLFLFFDGKELHKALELTSFSEAGIFGIDEKIIFPSDQRSNTQNAMHFTRRVDTTIDESINWIKTDIFQIDLRWDGAKILPENFRNLKEPK